MKFTKQEQSLIKLAAAHMAPQILKKATLQDKLAEYGIGLRKQAADIPESLKEAPKPGFAQAANPLLSFSKPKPGFEWVANQTQTSAPAVKPSGAQAEQIPSGKQKLLNAVRNSLMQSGNQARKGALAGYALGSALRGAKPAAAPAGQMGAQRDPGQKPMIGAPVPTNATIESPYDDTTSRQYPYMSERAGNQYFDRVGGRDKAIENARVFDDALNLVMERNGGVMDQAAVESARKAQATELARQISAPGTNQYDDAIQMLIQAGRNNQERFENSGSTYETRPVFDVPTGYEGKNRLNGGQQKALRDIFPAMGSTGNFRRFSNLS